MDWQYILFPRFTIQLAAWDVEILYCGLPEFPYTVKVIRVSDPSSWMVILLYKYLNCTLFNVYACRHKIKQ